MAVGVFVFTAFLFLSIGGVLVLFGLMPFWGGLSIAGPAEASTGQRFTGFLMIIAGLILGLLGTGVVGFEMRRWARR